MLGGNIWAVNLFFCLIFRTVPSLFWREKKYEFPTKFMFLKKVLVLHAEKGLVRAGNPDLTLFHQATTIIDITIVTIAIAVTSVFIVTMAIMVTLTLAFTSVTNQMKCTVTFIPTAVLGCCVFF